ncbi:MAG: DUF167 domain-containing protein [Anaerolineaceae bacterium]|nr:DUF167 domain-containing protein [Anaerolineaceae bacterium]
MESKKHNFHNGKTGAAITIRVTPRASKNEISGIQEDGTIKVRLTAPPVEGQANTALIHFLADLLQVAPSRIEIIAGLSGRDKLVTVTGMDADAVQVQVLKSLPK